MGCKKILVEPSIFCSDLGRIAEEAKRVEGAGADAIHIDFMDGHFVPNLALCPDILAAINRTTELFLDVHLMVYSPFDYIEGCIAAGADRLTLHIEATEAVDEVLDYIRKCNVQASLALSPETSFEMVERYLPKCSSLLLMAVHPGFGGQVFMPEVLGKIERARAAVDAHKLSTIIQVDGGINLETGKQCVEAGAHALVSGSYLFSQIDLKTAIAKLKGCR